MPSDSSNPSDLFALIAANSFRHLNCQVLPYDRKSPRWGRDGILPRLYRMCLDAAPARPWGVLPEAFCGMSDLTHDGIVGYLATRNPLLLMLADNGSVSNLVGFSFASVFAGPPKPPANSTAPVSDPGRSILKGYVISRDYWGQPESVTCMMLSGVYWFHTFNLLTIQGQSYPHNYLTRKFVAQFGTRTIATLPKFLSFRNEETGEVTCVDSVHSCLQREDFEEYVAKVILKEGTCNNAEKSSLP